MIKDFEAVQKYLFKTIPQQSSQLFPGNLGLSRTRYFLKLLGDPQNRLNVVHIAGTSGKGSTAYLISLILTSLGFRVGLTLSPHLLDIRERIQINNQLISRQKFVQNLNYLIPFIEMVKKSKFGSPTYFEILIVLAFYTFLEEGVDYVSLETGLGGLFDATNSITNSKKVSVITKIGLDHTKILGNTIHQITTQKAGIIQRESEVFSSDQSSEAKRVLEAVVSTKKSHLTFIKKGINFKTTKITQTKTVFSFNYSPIQESNIELGLIGEHQVENCSLALATSIYLSQRDNFKFDIVKVKKCLKSAHFKGRLDIKQHKNSQIILDGAHNPQKMKSLITTLKKLKRNNKFHFLLSFKKGKDSGKIIKMILPYSSKITLSSFFTNNQDLTHLSQDTKEVENIFNKLGFNNYQIIPNPKEALEKSLQDKNILVITGSLYFLSEIYMILNEN